MMLSISMALEYVIKINILSNFFLYVYTAAARVSKIYT